MKSVLLLAYTNMNFGDDMFIKTICAIYPEIEFELEAPENYKKIMSSVTNLKIVTHAKIFTLLEKIDSLILRVLPLNVGFFRYLWLKRYIAVVYIIPPTLWQPSSPGQAPFANAVNWTTIKSWRPLPISLKKPPFRPSSRVKWPKISPWSPRWRM